MTLYQKLILIDGYLAEERVDPQWREMIKEYRDMLVKRQRGSKWVSAKMQHPDINQQVLCATVYIDEGKLKRDYCVGSYDGKSWNCACMGDIVTHWANIEEIDVEEL